MIKAQVIAACRHLLGPVVRLLIRNAVTWNEFAELAKEVFVDIARQDYGIQGRPTNISRVAMLTGLSRREVTRIRDVLAGVTEAPIPAETRISQVLTGWHLDPEFLDEKGQPAELEPEGKTRSLAALLKRYAGDLPHGAFIKELQQLDLIERRPTGYRALARTYVRSPADPDMVRQAGVALHDHAQTLTHNVDAGRQGPPRFERMATTLELGRAHISAFHSFLEKKGQAFLEEADAWLSEHAERVSDGSKDADNIRAGVGVYLIHDETRRGQADD